MPFSCVFQLNNGAIAQSDEVIFQEFIEDAFGNFHEEKVRIARVMFNNEPAFISSNCPCFISSTGILSKGQKVIPETKIGYFSAEGEDIPYDKPYAIIDKGV